MERAVQRTRTVGAFERAVMEAAIDENLKKRVVRILDEASSSVKPILIWNRARDGMVEQTRRTVREVFENHGVLLNVLDGILAEKLETYNLPSIPQREKTKLAYHHYLEHLSKATLLPNVVPEDPIAAQSQEEGIPLLFSHPDAPAAAHIREIALLLAARYLGRPGTHADSDERLEVALASI